MAEQPPFSLPQAHRWFAIELNNRADDDIDFSRDASLVIPVDLPGD